MTALDPAIGETLRAVAEVFVPGPPHDETAGAADIAAELFVAHYLEYLVEGMSGGVAALLDELSTTHHGARFVALPLDAREDVLDRLAAHDVPQLRDLPTLLGVLSLAAVYGEWSGQDAEGRLVRRPLGWDMTGFDGPSRGRRALLRPGEA